MGDLGEAVLRLVVDLKDFVTGLGTGTKQLEQFGDVTKKVGGYLSEMGQTALLLSATLGAMLAPAILQGSEFEQTMSNVKAVVDDLKVSSDATAKAFADVAATVKSVGEVAQSGADSTAVAFAALESKAKQLGSSTAFSASEVAEAMMYLGQAGMSAREIYDGVEDTLSLASAGMLELGQAAEIASKVMISFKLTAQDIGRVADTLAKTASASNSSVESLGEGMKYTAPLAATLGQSVEDTAIALGLLANAGQDASVGGTGLARMMTLLAQRTDKVQALAEKYRISLDEIDPTMNSIIDIIKRFQQANISAADAMEAFQAQGGKALLALMNSSEESINSLTNSIRNNFGEALRQAAIQGDNLKGTWDNLTSAVEGLNISIYNTIKGAFSGWLTKATQIVEKITEWVDNNKELVGQIGAVMAVLAGVGAVVGTAMVAIGGLISAIGSIAGAIAALGGIKVVLIGIGVAIAALGPLIIIITGIAGAWQELGKAIQALWTGIIKPFIDGFMKGLSDAYQNMLKPSIDGLIEAFKMLFNTLAEIFGYMGEGKSVTEAIGYVIGTVLVAAVSLLTRIIQGIVLVWTAWFTVIKEAWGWIIKAAQAIGLLEKETKKSSETAAQKAARMKALQTQMETLTQGMKKYNDETGNATKKDQEYITLLERKGTLSDAEVKRLQELERERGTNLATMQKEHAVTKQNIEAVKAKIASYEKAGLSTKQLGIELTVLQKLYQTQEQNIARAKKVQDEHGTSLSEYAKKVGEASRAENERKRALEQLQALTEEITKREEDISKLRGELAEKNLNHIEKELQKNQELYDSRMKLIESQIKDLEARKAAMQVLGDDTSAIDQQIAKLKDLTREVQNAAAAEANAIRQKAADKRADYLRDQEIKKARDEGDLVRAAQLENEKIKQEKQKLFDELFAMDGKNNARIAEQRRQAEARLNEELAANLAKAQEEMDKKDKKPVVDAAEREKNIEKEITGQLAGQVKSVRDMYMLYMAIAQVRQFQEMRALQAANMAEQAEMRAARLKEAAAKRPDDPMAQLRANQAGRQANLLDQIAGKRAGEAGLEGEALNVQKKQVDELSAALEQAKQKVNLTKAELKLALDELNTAFAGAPKQWVDSFIGAWVAEAQRMVEAVAATMAQIKTEMLPTTEHSPSLVQIWDMNVGTIAAGLQEMKTTISKSAPNLSELNFGQSLARQGTPISAGAFGGGNSPSQVNDNRRVEMVVNNNVDVDNVKRQIGKAIGRAGMKTRRI